MSSKTERRLRTIEAEEGGYAYSAPTDSFVETTISDTDSVTLSTNAKGQMQCDIKVYFGHTRTPDEALALAVAMEREIAAEYGERYAGWREEK